MAKSHISGFPELLPEEKLVENGLMDSIRRVYESYGYSPIETSAVESLDVLLSKGSDDKEIYVLQRHTPKGEAPSPADMGLHFDLTIPLARYVSQNKNELSFPFKRHQIQKCWRGERPQEGRFREFYQADVDVICTDNLPLHYDAEVLEVGIRAMHSVAPGKFEVVVNNRKVVDGICTAFGLNTEQKASFSGAIDKLHKIGEEKCKEVLLQANIPQDCIELVFAAHREKRPLTDAKDILDSFGSNEALEVGKSELLAIAGHLPADLAAYAKFDPCTVRGLNYYTGTIFEGALHSHPHLSVCAGGRYDNLSELVGKQKMPGVGMSIGISRLYALLKQADAIKTGPATTSKVLISAFSEIQRHRCHEIANSLREKDVPCEEYFNFDNKIGKQIQYATRKGIRFVLFLGENGNLELKNLETHDQKQVSLDDLHSSIS